MRIPTYAAAMAAICALPLPTAAQTMDDAVRANVALALKICVDSRANPAAAIAAFQAVGFDYKPTAEANGDTWHRFFGPAETMRAEILVGQTAPSCDVHTNHLPPDLAARFVRSVLDAVYQPNFFAPMPPFEGTCAVFTEATDDPLALNVTVSATDGTTGCATRGSTVISIFSAV